MKKKGTIKDMQKIARARGGSCLSTEYIDTHSKLIWKCAHGHEWEAKPLNVKQGTWCPACAGLQKVTLEQMQALAAERGGFCLSKKYINTLSSLKWRCAHGHQWQAPARHLRQGNWCPDCARASYTATLEQMQALAAERGGFCLSEIYINAHSKLFWQCKEGHKWQAMPYKVKEGTWCPICAREARMTEHHAQYRDY